MYCEMNTASWIVLAILILIVLIVIFAIYRNRNKGCCGCGKDNCPYKNKNNKNCDKR